MNIRMARSVTDIERVTQTLLQLRSSFDREGLIAQIAEQQKNGYEIAYVEHDGQILCVAGFVVSTKLAWGKHIYVDDLVTDSESRSTGAGTFMLNWLKAHAAALGCAQIHLDSGVQRYSAHRFYLRNGFEIRSHHFCLSD
jgi:GNAT superfamily N-acetyltransferase